MYRILISILFLQGLTAYGQSCSSLDEPRDGDVDVPVDSPIRWSEVPDPIGYVISLGTTPGGTDIISNRSSGLRNFYIPETGLPADTQIYVTISFFKAGQGYTTCEVETFRTSAVTDPPDCTTLAKPLNGTSNITAETKLEWNYAPTATGYLLSVGTTPGGTEVFDKFDMGNVLEYEPPEGLPADGPVYVTLTPYNEIGEATSCPEENFTTTSVVIDCGPFFDSTVGEQVFLGPEIDFPERIGFCTDRAAVTVESSDVADGFRWYAINPDGGEILLSTDSNVSLSSIGRYRYEAYNNVTRSTSTVECANSMIFNLMVSETAVITSIDEGETSDGRRLQVNVTGEGNYKYALDDSEGPYQDSAVFENVSSDFHFVYVRDKNGCGIAESSVQRNLSPDDFPKFFTPNGDDVNDYWQFIAPEAENEIVLETIQIFNRFGNLLAVVDPDSKGWDGTYLGRRLPSSDYWFRATALNGQQVKGHFSLKR
jgi:gliding motility-associated-like protein